MIQICVVVAVSYSLQVVTYVYSDRISALTRAKWLSGQSHNYWERVVVDVFDIKGEQDERINI